MQKPLAQKLVALFEVRNSLVGCETVEAIVEKALEIAREKLHTQTASVFLFSKTGLLERVGIQGIDKNGMFISNDWFPDEKYSVGESFTGKVILPRQGSHYGVPHWSNKLARENINPRSKALYLRKLGTLNCAIAVPLNGKHRTYGILEVINKIDKGGQVNSQLGFSQDDVYWLSNIGINLATAISSVRRRNELEILADISQMLVEPFSGYLNARSIYREMIGKLVGPLLSYKACILRIGNSMDKLEVVAKAGDKIVWGQRVDTPISTGERLAGKVYATGKREIVEDIELKQGDFRNLNWIRANGLKSFICLPLSVKSKIVGTLSLFTGYVHVFYPSDISFLENIAFLIASFTESSRLIDELQELDRERESLISSARAVGYDLSVQSILHDYKHELQGLLRELVTAESSSPSYRLQIIKQQIAEIRKKIEKITVDMDQTANKTFRESVDINQLIQSEVRFFNLQLKREGFKDTITISTRYSSEIPLILANEIEIKDVVFNLLSNAVKAVRSANRKKGEILITTNVVQSEIPYIEIAVEDNGVGIRNEDKHRIYERGYTTYEGGSGAGLFIAHNIVVNIYGGIIDCTSTVGKGTRFFVWLPKKRLEV